MLKWLSGVTGAAEARRVAEGAHGRDVADSQASNEGAATMQAYTLNAAYAESMAEGKSNAYSIVYAAAYGIGRSIIGASEEWARSYAQACAHAIAAGAPVRFVSAYGHAVADGASPEDAFVFARRCAV